MADSDAISVKINIMDGENFITACRLSDTVEMLKRRIESVSSIPFNYQRLIFRGRVLRNDQTLQECNIENNCVVFVVKQSVLFFSGNFRCRFPVRVLLNEVRIHFHHLSS